MTPEEAHSICWDRLLQAYTYRRIHVRMQIHHCIFFPKSTEQPFFLFTEREVLFFYNGNANAEAHEGELTCLLVDGIRDNKGSHK